MNSKRMRKGQERVELKWKKPRRKRGSEVDASGKRRKVDTLIVTLSRLSRWWLKCVVSRWLLV